MNNITPDLEIILVFNTWFVNKRRWEKKQPPASENFNPKEQLMDACWNGYLPEFLPEVFDKKYDSARRLWELNETNSFIELSYSDVYPCIDSMFSINPYHFCSEQCCN